MIFGVVLITRPPFIFGRIDSNTNNSTSNGTTPIPDIDGISPELQVTMGYVCAIAVPLFSAIISILTRQCKHVPAYQLMFWFGAGALIVSSFCKSFTFGSSNNDVTFVIQFKQNQLIFKQLLTIPSTEKTS